MNYYGIRTPGTPQSEPYIWWISDSPSKAWDLFFTCPNRDREHNPYRLCMAEASGFIRDEQHTKK